MQENNNEDSTKPEPTKSTQKSKTNETKSTTTPKEQIDKETTDLTANSVYFDAEVKREATTPHKTTQQATTTTQEIPTIMDEDESAHDAFGDDEEDTDMEDNDDEEDNDEEGIQLPDIHEKKAMQLTFHRLWIRYEKLSDGTFHPLDNTKNLLIKATKHSEILGLASPESQLITPRIFPKEEEKFKPLVQMDYARVSCTKVRMTILMAIATKSEITINELKTPEVIAHLQSTKAFVSEQKYDKIGVEEIGFFSKLHDKITNRTKLQAHIETEYQQDHEQVPPHFELYTKGIYARAGNKRANSRVISIRTGQSNAKEMTEYFCQLAAKGAFGNAIFVPKGIDNKTLIHHIQAQNRYLQETTTIPILGLTREILDTSIKIGQSKTSFQEYILQRADAECFEATDNPDRWLMVLPKNKQENAHKFINNDFHELFKNTQLPQHDRHSIPHHPGSKHSHSAIFNTHARTLENESPVGTAFLRPPPRQKPSKIVVSYAAAVARSATPQQHKQPIVKTPKNDPTKDIQKMRQSVKQQIRNANVELHADLEAQVCTLQAQIQALQTMLVTLQSQVHSIATMYHMPIPTEATNITTNAMETEPEASSPREREPKRHRPGQLKATTPAFEPEIQEMDEESRFKKSDSQPNLSTDPNLGMDPGEEDSTLL